MGNDCPSCCCEDAQDGSDVNTKTRKFSVSDEPWAQAVNDGNESLIKTLLNDDHDLYDTPINSSGHTALHLCVINQNYSTLEWLCKHNANVNIPSDNTGNTPLHEAAKIGDGKSISILMQYGANYTIGNKNGKTAYQLASTEPARQALKNPKKYIRKETIPRHKMSNNNYGKIESSMSSTGGSIHSQTITDKEHSYSVGEITSRVESLSVVGNQLDRRGPSNPNDPPTWFGSIMGVELEDVADFVRRLPNRSKMWDAFLGTTKQSITNENKNKDLFRLVFGTIYATIKKKNRSAPQPDKLPAKAVMLRIVQLLIEENKRNNTTVSKYKYEFTKNKFSKEFHQFLYQCSDDIRDGILKNPKHN